MPRTFLFGGRRIAVGILAVPLLAVLSGCPPLFVRFRPETVLGSVNAPLVEATDQGVEVKTEGLTFLLPPMRFDKRYLVLRLRFAERRQPLTIRTADIYVAAESGRRINLSGVQYQTAATSYVTAYAGGTGESKLADSYVLGTQVEQIELIFDAENEELGGTITLHLEGMEIGDRTARLVYRYRLDCENLGKDWPLLERWLSIGAFSRYCRQ